MWNRVCHLSKRCVSTQQYIPGRKGYAPGFAPPEGTRESIKIQKKRGDIATSIPSHLGAATEKSMSEANSTKQLYRRELKLTRLRYARELLEKQGQKEMESAEKVALAEKKKEEMGAYFRQAKEEQKKHEEQVMETLDLDINQASQIKDRTEQRNINRMLFDEQQRQVRRQQLIKLYAETEEFVTLDNLDAKVDLALQNRKHVVDLNELMSNSNDLHVEIEKRKEQIKQVMGI
ncbi:hypothetical protein BCV72DRAFT_323768 [Rhizopus microsporus var. microsporus]|nr:hypothetical protein BCV72DRAFT_323768 [Rhizopus microsporus var. microsporus]